MRDDRSMPNGERPPSGGGRVTPSRAARHAPPPERPSPEDQALGNGYGAGTPGAGGYGYPQAGAQDPGYWNPGSQHPGDGNPQRPDAHAHAAANGQRQSRGTPDGYGQYGNARNGYAPNGYAPNGYAPGRRPNGYPANGYAPNGYAPNGYAAQGRGRGASAPDGYAPDGYAPDGRSSSGYAPSRAPGGANPSRVVPSRAARHAAGRTRTRSAAPQRVAPSRAARPATPATTRQARHARRRQRSFWTELPVLIIAAFVLAIGVKGYVVQAFYIPSGSMKPTLQVNDRVVVNRLAFGGSTHPQHGDVVVFVREIPGAPPPDPGPFGAVQRAVAQGLGNAPPGSEDLIKRVIGVPGDVVEGREGRLWRNGQPVDEPYLTPGTLTDEFGPVTVEPGHLWVMGDNRGDSADSRAFGQVPVEDLVGRAEVLVWPFDHVGGL